MSKPLIGTLVVLFLAMDVALGVAVWRHMGWSDDHGLAMQREAPVFAPTTAGAAPTTGADGFQKQDASTATMVGAAADGTVIAATAGACGGSKPSVLVSSDAGNTLAPTKPDVSRVLAVQVQSDGTILLTGADADCKALGLTSRDGGATWGDAPLGAGWYLDPESPTGVVSPGGPVDAGCAVVGLSPVDDKTVHVLCDDGTVVSTEDTGKTWLPMASIKDVRAVSFDSATSGVALVQTGDCAASTFVTADGGDTWDKRGCIEGQRAQSVLDLGKRVLAVVDAKVATSTDGGLTWRVPSAG